PRPTLARRGSTGGSSRQKRLAPVLKPGPVPLIGGSQSDPEHHTGRCGGIDPVKHAARGAPQASGRGRAVYAGKADDAWGPPIRANTAGNLLPLSYQVLRGEDRVRLGVRLDAQGLHELREPIVSLVAVFTVRQMLGHRGIDRLSAFFGEIALEQAPV